MTVGELTWDVHEHPANPSWMLGPDKILTHRAWSDQLQVAGIIPNRDGTFFWDATWAVKLEDQAIVRGAGTAATLEEAKVAVQHAWTTWLRFAGLIE